MPRKVSENVWVSRAFSDGELGYLAGFVDGEGTLTIQRAVRRESRAGCRHEARMSVANSCRVTMDGIQRTYGGRLLGNHRKPDKQHHKQVYVLLWTANQIRLLLPLIRPYLRVKAKQADVLTEFLAGKANGRNLTAEDWQRSERLRTEIKRLNWRGAGEPPEFETLALRESRRGNNQWQKKYGLAAET
jgi:hypothetical protein